MAYLMFASRHFDVSGFLEVVKWFRAIQVNFMFRWRHASPKDKRKSGDPLAQRSTLKAS